ncbi:MAG TPA: alpha-glucan family phosphorylase [Candidatus Binatia bacterium]|nr:alpha-glucan family phosphorylase [Candidatus Binatia bacterium]
MDGPSLLERLRRLAGNLWWTWQPEIIAIFRDLDPELWRAVNHNPVAFLALASPPQLEARAEELAIDGRINLAFRRLEQYLRDPAAWGATACGPLRIRPVAYFSAEFALHESIPIYSGGLGALAGDHVKAASDLGVPLVGIGIFYGQGYFRQRLTADGWQQEEYGHTDLEHLPLERAAGADGRPVVVEVPLDNESLHVAAWRAQVGRATLLLLDSDLEGNRPDFRALTAHLYGGDAQRRLRQEMILGVGGMRMLEALGIRPGVLHLNEGHCALAPIECARALAARSGVAFHAAHREVALRTVFTTHTPVSAGHDWFEAGVAREHLAPLAAAAAVAPDDLLALGRVDPADHGAPFCMTVLALRSARRANAVSALHGHVTRQMWQCLWPGRPEAEVPIGHVTNGVHVASWLAPQMRRLGDLYLGRDWLARVPESLTGLDAIDDAAFWEVHQGLKRDMLHYLVRRGAGRAAETQVAVPALDVDVLTMGFARRFAEYKRATLLLRDLERLARLVNAPGRGLQLVFAGKAHPQDDPGKRMLQRVFALTRDPRFRDRVVLVEDYDISVARHLVQACDVWLNTPRRPLEACGTSGQKVVLNGGLNLSVLDGWWAEAYDGRNGFAFGDGEVHADAAVQDARDAESLYRVLEGEVVPLYYERDAANVPTRWVARVRHAVRTLAPRFTAERMVRDYVHRCYLPAAGGLSAG